MIWCVIWTVLMMAWLFGNGIYNYNSANPPSPAAFGTGTLIPWGCVLILGLIQFGGITVGPIR